MGILGKLRDLVSPLESGTTEFPGVPLELEAFALTDVGRARSGNEDSVLLVPGGSVTEEFSSGLIAVLADGMGGNNAGEIASAIACKTVSESVVGSRSADLGAALVEAVRVANQVIFTTAAKHPEHRGMGTTLVAFAIRNRSAYLAYVGDSRLYMVRQGKLYQLSEDHSVVFEMVKRGLMSLSEASRHPDRNVLSRALGTRERVECSRWNEPFEVHEGDTFLLCSDGLHDLVDEAVLLETLLRNRPAGAASLLIAEANRRGGHDNISAIVVRVRQPQEASADALPESHVPVTVPITREIVLT